MNVWDSNMTEIDSPPSPRVVLYMPLLTREAFAANSGIPLGVLIAQCERGYWPQVTIGKRVFINVEAVRARALERANEFTMGC